jgi:outer membrane protein assembly factor BamB
MVDFLSHQFLSHQVGKGSSGASSQSLHDSMPGATLARQLCLTLLVVCAVFLSSSFAQQPFATSRGDNARDGANTHETLLTPANVNMTHFGKLFSFPVDYVVMAQPLYVPNVNIPGQGTHNVVYVATEADSVYAIDAETGTQLWHASMLNGGTTASGIYLPCGSGPGFLQEGITGTPVIDPTTNTMYLVAKTLLGTTVRHHIHAIDITTGNEQPGSPVLITATSTSKKGHVTHFNSLHQKNRPGLLLLNGVLYLGFGSNYCNDANSGWVLSYDTAPLSQLPVGVFNTSPDYGLTSIWQSGNGLAADDAYVAAPNIFASTAEAGSNGFDIPSGGQTYCMSVLKLAPDITADPADYFIPANWPLLNSHDMDLSSSGPMVLPDQNGPWPHELVVTGKYGVAFVLNRDNLGMYSAGDSNALQEVVLVPNSNTNPTDVMMSSPAYWNNTVYFTPNNSPILAFPLSAGVLGTPVKTYAKYPGAHSPSISANGNANGILWEITGQLLAFDAVSLKMLYGSGQAGTRDTLPTVGHFATQTVANGRVYVGTRTSLEAYGLFRTATVTGGRAQTATVATKLPVPIQVQVANPYTGQPVAGVTVNFSDGGKGGSFSPAASAVTDSNGNASAFYTLPQKSGTYTLTMSGTGFGNATTTATATPGPAIRIYPTGGQSQTGAAGSILPKPLVAQAQDIYKNGVSGVTVHFTNNQGAVPNPPSAVTDVNGFARTNLQLPTTVAKITVIGSCTQYILTCAGFTNISFVEYSVAGPASSIAVTGGNNQSASAGTQLPLALTVLVTDQYGNPVPSAGVTFDDGGAGGSFSNANPVLTSTSGTASQFYTLPSSPKTVTIDATVSGVGSPAVFTETGH